MGKDEQISRTELSGKLESYCYGMDKISQVSQVLDKLFQDFTLKAKKKSYYALEQIFGADAGLRRRLEEPDVQNLPILSIQTVICFFILLVLGCLGYKLIGWLL